MPNVVVRQTGSSYGDARAFVHQYISGNRGHASITLDMTKFVPATHYPKGFLPTGLVLGKITATGRYGPYDNTATDGREVAAGFLWEAFTPTADEEVTSLWFGPGSIRESKLPLPIDAPGKVDLASWFKFF